MLISALTVSAVSLTCRSLTVSPGTVTKSQAESHWHMFIKLTTWETRVVKISQDHSLALLVLCKLSRAKGGCQAYFRLPCALH